MHNGFVEMGETKMSKSLGNIITPREMLDAGWHGEVLRLALLSAHYRQPLSWTDELMGRSKARLDRYYRRKAAGYVMGAALSQAILDDLNTPEALVPFPEGADLLGLGLQDPSEWFRGGVDQSTIDAELNDYRAARGRRDWRMADSIRERLRGSGIELSVAKDGTISWHKA
jgi:cysteinyl-tRNA synthetase